MSDKKYKPGLLSDEKVCPTCDEPVSIDVRGNCLCYQCGGFVDAVPVGTIKIKRRKNTQIPLIPAGWGMPF